MDKCGQTKVIYRVTSYHIVFTFTIMVYLQFRFESNTILWIKIKLSCLIYNFSGADTEFQCGEYKIQGLGLSYQEQIIQNKGSGTILLGTNNTKYRVWDYPIRNK